MRVTNHIAAILFGLSSWSLVVATPVALEARAVPPPDAPRSAAPQGGTEVSAARILVTNVRLTTVEWTSSLTVDLVRGDLDALRASGGEFNGTARSCVLNNVTGHSKLNTFVPSPGAGIYYLLRGAGTPPPCTLGYSWRTGAPQEQAGSGGDRDADLASDPLSCP